MTIGSVLSHVFSFLTAPRPVVTIVGSLALTAVLIYWPYFTPYYRLTGYSIRMTVDAGVQSVAYEFRTQQALTVQTAYATTDGVDQATAVQSASNGDRLVFAMPDDFPGGVLELSFARVPFIDVASVWIDDREQPVGTVGELFLTSGQVMRVQLLRESISDLILKLNDTVANWLLAFLVAVFLFLVGRWASLWTKVRIAAMQQRRNLPVEVSEKPEKLERSIGRFNTWKVLGPSFGFLLTVSSLAAALHPSVQAAQDAYTFLAAVQVAVISTFVGLLVRIVAHGCITAAERLLEMSLPGDVD